MAAATCLLSEEEIMCAICLEVLTDPVSTPCGHNFCKDCITENWRVNSPCRCPFCNEVFHIRPQLKTNIFISAMVAQFRQRAQQNLTNNICPRHNKPLELFCESDQTCVCVHCSLQHKNHELVPLKEGCEAKQRELKRNESQTQRMIQERREKIREIQQSLDLSQRAAEEEAAEGVQFFSALMELVQKGLNEVLQEIEEKQTKAKKQAEKQIQALEQEISELNQRSTEVEQLTSSKDHLHVLKTFTSVTPAPNKDRTKVRIRTPSFLGTVQRAVLQIEKQLLTMELKPLSQSQLKEVHQSAVDVTLDPDTAHPELSVSEDLKQVSHTGVKKNVTNNSKRITGYQGVLGRESFSSGRYYFEVQVSENSTWAVGVAKESINKKEDIDANPPNGFWVVGLYKGINYGTADPDYVLLTVKSVVQRVGVFVVYKEGLVCFYDVDTAALIYCFSGCNFTEKLYPYFFTVDTEENSAPLIITPVTKRE